MRSTHRILISAVAASLVLVTSACGSSSGSDGSKDDTTTTTEAEAATTTKADDGAGADAEAQARADSVTLEVADFPEGWEATPSADSDEESPLSQCDPALGDRSVQLARHSTDDFAIGSMDAGDGTTVTARTVVFEDEAAAEAAVAPFSDPDVISCIDEQLKGAYTASGDGVTVEGTLAPGDESFDVDETATLSATYTVTGADDSTLDVNLGVLVLRTGDVATNLLVQSVDPNFDVTTLPVDKLVEELNAA